MSTCYISGWPLNQERVFKKVLGMTFVNTDYKVINTQCIRGFSFVSLVIVNMLNNKNLLSKCWDRYVTYQAGACKHSILLSKLCMNVNIPPGGDIPMYRVIYPTLFLSHATHKLIRCDKILRSQYVMLTFHQVRHSNMQYFPRM